MTQGFLPAVTGGQYSTLRGTGAVPSGAGGAHASQLPNTVVFKAHLNAVQSGNSFAQNEWTSAITGAYTNALPGQLLLLSNTSNYLNPYFTGRVRQAFGATTFYFNETSISQAGTDYLTVIDDYPIMDALLRYLVAQTEYFADYGISYRALRPLVGSAPGSVGLHGAYAGFVDSVSSKFRISISALFYPCQSAATITSWSVSLVDGTLIAGSLTGSGTTTGTITADFPAGFRHVLITVTNSSGVSTTTAIKVWAETRSGSATLITGLDGYNITYDVSTPNALQSCTINVFSNELQSTLNNTPICVWDEEIVNGVLGSIGGNVRFIGRLRKEDNQNKASAAYVRTLQTAWTLEGPDTQLNRLDALKMTFRSNTTPTIWGDIASLSMPKLISILLTEFTTAANSLVINFDDYSDTFPYPVFNTAGNTMLAVLNDVGLSINAQMMFTGDGRALFARHAFFQSNATRNALTTVADWTDQDRTADLSYSLDDIRNVAQVDAWGGVWTGGTTVIPLHAQAPGLARDIGERNIPLLKQILSNVGVAAAQTELDDRAGNAWLKEATGSRLKATHLSAYAGVITPDISAWYTWTTSVSDSLRSYVFSTSTRWILEKLTLTRENATGKLKLDATYLQETNGIGYGNTIAILTSNTLPVDQLNLALGTYPLIQAIVPPITVSGVSSGQLGRGLNNLALILSDGTVTYTKNFSQTPPTWTTPASLGVSGTVLRWIPDFTVGRYAGWGGNSYGWIITSTNIYYGYIDSPAAFASRFTFRNTSLLRSASASLSQPGHVIVSSVYGDGIWTTDSVNVNGVFTAEIQLDTVVTSRAPGAWYSQHISLQALTSISGAGRKTTDGGATYSAYAAINPGSDAAADIAVAYADNPADAVFYYGKVAALFYDFTTSMDGEGGIYGPPIQTYDFTAQSFLGIWTPGPGTPGITWIAGSGWQSVFAAGSNRVQLLSQNYPYAVERWGFQGTSPANSAVFQATPFFLDGSLHYYVAGTFAPGTAFITITEGSPPYDNPPPGDENYINKIVIVPLPNTPSNKWGKRNYNLNGFNEGYWSSGTGYSTDSTACWPMDRTFGAPISPSNAVFTFTGNAYEIGLICYDASGNFLGSVVGGTRWGGAGTSPMTISFGGITGISKIEMGITWNSGPPALQSLSLTGVINPSIQKYNGSSSADVSPLDGFGPWKSQQISIALDNSNILAVAAGDATQTTAGIWVSSSAGAAWTQIVAPTTNGSTGRYTWIPMSSDGNHILYPAGTKGNIGYAPSLTGVIVSKIGNLSTAAEVVGLAGL